MWAVVTVIGMSLVKREEKHHIRYQFKSKRATPPLERHCVCSSKLTVHHRRSEGETEVKHSRANSQVIWLARNECFISCTFVFYISLPVHMSFSSPLSDSQCMGEISSSQNTPTCNLFSVRKQRFVQVCVGLRSGLFKSEECVANLQVLPSLCPTQQTGSLSHLSGFLCLDLSNALQSFSLSVFFAVCVILVAWLCLNFIAGSFFIVHVYNPKLALSVRLTVHLFVLMIITSSASLFST